MSAVLALCFQLALGKELVVIRVQFIEIEGSNINITVDTFSDLCLRSNALPLSKKSTLTQRRYLTQSSRIITPRPDGNKG